MRNKIGKSLKKILDIRFDNEHGGKYAYMQFLAYARELVHLLRPMGNTQRQADAIEGIAWVLNENLAGKFSHTQRAVFETRMMDLRGIVNELDSMLRTRRYITRGGHTHAQAA
jgi:hypothetical protein